MAIMLKKLREEKENTNPISLKDWGEYFKNLNSNQVQSKMLPETQEGPTFSELDFRISEKEIIAALKYLKNNKAVGLDLISNEMLRYSQHAMMPVMLLTFNSILMSKCYPKSWCSGYIIPIFKNGNFMLPENYRGITIMSCFAKLFNTVINNRIDSFLEEKKLIDTRQIGFKKGLEQAIICLS